MRERLCIFTVSLSSHPLQFAAYPLVRIAPYTNGLVQLTGGGISNLAYTLESSTNFVDWQTLFTAPAPLWFTDSPTNARRFYRLTR